MIRLSSPHLSGREKHYIDDAFALNRLFAFGENVDGFEQDLEIYLGNDTHVAALNSGTAAIHMALILLGVTRGDEVICQSLTFAASANPVVYLGAIPIFIDSEAFTYNICPEALETAIKARIAAGKRPKAIIAVHLYGMPYMCDEIMQVANRYGIPVIEDSAEALGSTYKGKKCGTLGDISVLSFNGNKIITTSSGGAVVAKTKAFKEKAIFLASQAKDPAPFYQHSQIGYNYRISNIAAGIGRGQMEVLEDRINLRRLNNEFYKDVFSDMPDVKVFVAPDEQFYSNYWLTTITVNEVSQKISAEGLRVFLQERAIECRPVWKPMHLQPVFKNCLFYGGTVAESIFRYGLCMPSGSNLDDCQKDEIKETIFDWYRP